MQKHKNEQAGHKMNIEIEIKITGPDGMAHTEKIATFTKGVKTIGEIGLSISESKELLLKLQQEFGFRAMRGVLRQARMLPAL